MWEGECACRMILIPGESHVETETEKWVTTAPSSPLEQSSGRPQHVAVH